VAGVMLVTVVICYCRIFVLYYMSQKGIRNIVRFSRTGVFALVIMASAVMYHTAYAQSFNSEKRLQNVPDSLLATSLDFGPDQRLYVSDVKGDIHIYSVVRDTGTGPNVYRVVNIEIINSVRQIQNHNDDASLHAVQKREVTGILVVGTAANPIIYVTSSDYRIKDILPQDTNLDTNSGTISRLIWNGSEWVKVDIVRGLPRSEENHATNGLLLDSTSNTLYVAQGGNTNAGAPYWLFGSLTEYALSGAILTVDLDSILAMPIKTDTVSGAMYIYDLPTVDDPTRDNQNGINSPMASGYDGVDITDPFGGNDGLNQARLVLNGPVQIYASGLRNPYDLVMTDAGYLYAWDNGPNPAWGGPPINTGYGTATNEYSDSNAGIWISNEDGLHRIDSLGYYAGHPNPIRSNPDSAGLFTGSPSNSVFRTEYDSTNSDVSLPYDWPPIDSSLAHPVEGIYYDAGSPEDPSLHTHHESTNGLAEYKATNFDSAMTGDIIAAGLSNKVYRVQLDSVGGVDTVTVLTMSGANLDVICQSDNDPFPGTIWIAVHSTGTADPIRILEPTDMAGCTGGDFPNIDEDLDGYTNADEIDNGTDPCSITNSPADHDGTLIAGFKVSDLNDPDDDDDGINDTLDFFAWDPDNGMSTEIPIDLTFLSGEPGTGFYGLGFTGFMTNQTEDYLDLWISAEDSTGNGILTDGTAGIITFEGVDTGDALSAINSQHNAFQLGFKIDSTYEPIIIEVKAVGPVFPDTIQDFQSMGAYIGTGDQDNYIKIVVVSNDSMPAISLGVEDGGVYNDSVFTTAGVDTALTLSFMFVVNPANGMVFPYYRLDGSDPVALGPGFVTTGPLLSAIKSNNALAIGIISTARGSTNRFEATWDNISVKYSPATNGGIELLGSWYFINEDDATCGPTGDTVNCPTARHECAYVESGDRFYLIGGRENNSNVEIYDPIDSVWTSGAAPPDSSLHHFQAFDYYGLVVAAGAFRGTFSPDTEEPVPNMLVYDPLVDTWHTGPPMPNGRNRGSAASVMYNDTLYLIGGNTMGHNNGSVRWADKFDIKSNTWTALPDAMHKRDHFHGAVINNKIYAASGRRTGEGGNGPTLWPLERTVDYFDISSQTWDTIVNPIPTERAGTAVAVLGEELVILGGENTGLLAKDSVEALNVNTETWRSLQIMNDSRHGTQAIVNNSAIYITSGSWLQGAAPINASEVYFQYGVTAPMLTPTTQSAMSTADTIAFGTSYWTDSVETYAVLRNTSGNQALLIHSASIDTIGAFSIDTAMTFPRFLKPGDSLLIRLQFAPDSMGQFLDSLMIAHTGANAPSTTIILRGEGLFTWTGGPRVYVDSSASGPQLGTAWDSAVVSLQTAMEAAAVFTDIREIWVARGTYLPGNGRTSTFNMVDSLSVFGGFAGTESLLSERDIAVNKVILSGDIGIAGDSTDNAYHVLSIGPTVDTARLDGVTIEKGNANATDPVDQRGSGLTNSGKTHVANTIIRNCTSTLPGSAIYSTGASAILRLNGVMLLDNSDPYLVNMSGSAIRYLGDNVVK
jgi:large repetitive protein